MSGFPDAARSACPSTALTAPRARRVVKADTPGACASFRDCCRAADHDRKQRIAAVRIQVPLARREIQVLLLSQHLQYVVVRDQVARVAPAREAEQIPLVADPARVMRELPDRDPLPEVRL